MIPLLSGKGKKTTVRQLVKERHDRFSLKRILSILLHRVVIVSVIILLQLALIVVMVLRFSSYFQYFYFICIAVSLAVVLYILCNRSTSAYKIVWIVPILLLPLFGGLIYLATGGHRLGRSKQSQLHEIDRRGREWMNRGPVEGSLSDSAGRRSEFVRKCCGYPAYPGLADYFELGDTAYPALLEDLKSAEHFIFLEYFILRPGRMWDSLLAVLTQKASEGVDVRVIYDDVGCLFTLPPHYWRRLEQAGVRCQVFNPYIPVLSTRLNNRDHRKLTVIDGRVGYVSGFNLADEYINAEERFGHWKDSGVRITGPAVYSLTVMFLSNWCCRTRREEDLEQFRFAEPQPEAVPADCTLQPYCLQPMDNDHLGENILIDLIGRADRYVYLTTPYLIIDESLMSALCHSARAGVDVRIITPHIPDKKTVFEITRAHYSPLMEAGVRIYEYTPGFMHSKNVVCDDNAAIVGTVNLDYRSLYLHFECAVLLQGERNALPVKEDFLRTLEQCEEIDPKRFRPGPLKRLFRALLRFAAPLL